MSTSSIFYMQQFIVCPTDLVLESCFYEYCHSCTLYIFTIMKLYVHVIICRSESTPCSKLLSKLKINTLNFYNTTTFELESTKSVTFLTPTQGINNRVGRFSTFFGILTRIYWSFDYFAI